MVVDDASSATCWSIVLRIRSVELHPHDSDGRSPFAGDRRAWCRLLIASRVEILVEAHEAPSAGSPTGNLGRHSARSPVTSYVGLTAWFRLVIARRSARQTS
jgi:hypothetical protein